MHREYDAFKICIVSQIIMISTIFAYIEFYSALHGLKSEYLFNVINMYIYGARPYERSQF